MKFKMSEFDLSKRILSEGNNTWGMKEGWLDVKDVKELIKRLKCYDKNKLLGKDFIVISKKDLNKLTGNKLTGEGNE